MRILISRTDNIGDVILTIPMAGAIKKSMPSADIIFLGKEYTLPVLKRSQYIDEILTLESLPSTPSSVDADVIIHVFPNRAVAKWAKRSGIRSRIGTSHRMYHWFTCNNLVNLGRKNSQLHESQLNLKLLKPLGISTDIALEEISSLYGFQKSTKPSDLDPQHPERFNLIFHPKSKGSAKEWPLAHFYQLAVELNPETYNIIVSGTAEEGQLIKVESPEIFNLPHVIDATGKYSLDQFIQLLEHCDGVVAASTGPLHIAAAAGINALGLYPLKRPMHAERWGPVGIRAKAISEKGSDTGRSLQIPVEEVLSVISKWRKQCI